ncbi:hypothetical protein MRX96_057585 [Rhipicephalus microplus]
MPEPSTTGLRCLLESDRVCSRCYCPAELEYIALTKLVAAAPGFPGGVVIGFGFSSFLLSLVTGESNSAWFGSKSFVRGMRVSMPSYVICKNFRNKNQVLLRGWLVYSMQEKLRQTRKGHWSV